MLINQRKNLLNDDEYNKSLIFRLKNEPTTIDIPFTYATQVTRSLLFDWNDADDWGKVREQARKKRKRTQQTQVTQVTQQQPKRNNTRNPAVARIADHTDC